MGGRGPGVKATKIRVVNNFLPGWLDKYIHGVRNDVWLEANPIVRGEARCKLCENPSGEKKVIKIAEVHCHNKTCRWIKAPG